MVNGSEGYVNWTEIVVSKEKGRREVHYYLKNGDGGMDLAVVGKERSARHMSYDVPARFLLSSRASSASCASPASTVTSSSPSPPPYSAPADNLSLKWRSRREVIRWLSSALSDSSLISDPLEELCDEEYGCIADDSAEIHNGAMACSTQRSSKFSWSCSPSTCSNQRQQCNSSNLHGTKTSCINSGARQLLRSTESSASSVLTSDDAGTLRKRTLTFGDDEHKVKRLEGMHRCMSPPLPQMDEDQKSQQFLLTKGQLIEVLSQDSGLRGCWFCCVVLAMHQSRIRVRYMDLQDADGSGPLEEWILRPRTGVTDTLGIRMQDRSTIRPQLLHQDRPSPSSLNVGSMVDAWWHDGWWEGLVVSKDDHHSIRVYFPGEGRVCEFDSGDLRRSQDWCKNKWYSLRDRPDLVSSLLSDGNGSPVPGDFLGHLKWSCSRKRGSQGLARRKRKFLLPPPLVEDKEVCNLVVS